MGAIQEALLPPARITFTNAVQLAAVLIASLLAGICWTYRNRGFRASSSANARWITGPEGRPFKGSVHELQTNGAASCKAWYSLYKRYGPAYEMTIPFFRLHVINHPTYLEHIQKHNSKNYVRGAFTRNTFGELHRSSVFVSDGKQWQFQRKAATRVFTKQNFDNHITKSLHHWLDVLTGLLSNLAREEISFDFQDLMGRFMFSLFLGVAFHEDTLGLDIISEDPESLHSKPEWVEAFDKATHLFDRRRRDPLWKITEKLSGDDKTSKKAVNLFYGQIDGLIKKRLEAIRNGYQPKSDGRVDLLDMFMQSTTDVYTLGGMVFAFLSAGRDTTAYTLSWLMKEIHHKDNLHLDAARKIRDEAAELGFADTYLGYGDTPKLKFLNAMWDETSRLDTVSPAGQLEAAEDDILPAVPELNMPARHVKKYVNSLFEKGDVVSYQNYVLSRMPEVWGDDAGVFDPARWFKEDGDPISYSPFKYHSWNAGPRSCLGRALATFEGLGIASAILNRFDVILEDDQRVYEPLAALNMGIRGGLPMKVKERAI